MTKRITSTDTETGHTETAEITNDWTVVVDGDKYLDGIQHPTTGVTVLTIKTQRK